MQNYKKKIIFTNFSREKYQKICKIQKKVVSLYVYWQKCSIRNQITTHMNKRIFLGILCIIICMTGCKRQSPDAEMNAFVSKLMAKMTVEEKLGQLSMPVTGEIVTGQAQSSNVADQIREGRVGALLNLKGVDRIYELQKIAVEQSRLGIPIIFCMDVIHGYETVYPIPLAISCSWDMQGIRQSASVAACEASADGISLTFSPMVDVCHDARWGRISEGSGEDPYLGSCVARAMVQGYQGEDLGSEKTIMACMKHFALYGAQIAGREYHTVDMSRYYMFNEYLQPYKAAVEAGVGSCMASFNTVDGIPSHGNYWMLTELLRKQWGYRGFVMADYCGVEQIYDHGGAADKTEAGIISLHAGNDMDMVSEVFPSLGEAYRQGRVDIKDIDRACRLVLEAKYILGLFDDPYRYCDPTRREKEILCAEHRAHARLMARESMVLLKNDKNVLPLQKKGTIALIGPLAATRPNMSGTWAVAAVPEHYKTIQEGLQDALRGTNARLLYAKGCNLMYDADAEAIATMFGREMRDPRSNEAMRAEALAIARQADVIVLAMGEASEMAGECSSRVDIEMPDAQHDLMLELRKLGKPIVLLHFAGRPTVLNWENEHLDAILEAWFAGSETADAAADLLFGDYSPCGRLTASLPRHVGQLPYTYRQFKTSRPMPEDEQGHVQDGFIKFLTCYSDVKSSPLFPFGYGLSYTTFDYSDLTLSATEAKVGEPVTAKVTVTNSGIIAADEVVQLYIRDMAALPVRPMKELRGFERIHLEPGESREVSFTIDNEVLGYYKIDISKGIDQQQMTDANCKVDPGEFRIMIGHDSEDLKIAKLTLK